MIVKWGGGVDPGLGKVYWFRDVAQSIGRFIAVGDATESLVRAMWSSNDGLSWKDEAFPVSLGEYASLWSVAGNDTGIVVVGDDGDVPIVWFSPGESVWTVAHPPAGFEAHAVVATADRFITFGWGGSLFVSTDGATWQQSTDPNAQDVAAGLQAATSYGKDAWAFSKGGMTEDLDSPVEIWHSGNGLDWALVGELPESRHEDVVAAAAGANGIAVVSGFSAWFSADGFKWFVSSKPPSHVHDLLADATGFVGVGAKNSGGCAKSELDDIGVTWTSVDGGYWQQMPGGGWHAREVNVLTSIGRTLIGLGVDYRALFDGNNDGMVWTSRLPDLATDENLVQTSPEPIPSTGC